MPCRPLPPFLPRSATAPFFVVCRWLLLMSFIVCLYLFPVALLLPFYRAFRLSLLFAAGFFCSPVGMANGPILW
jgi:hypothetical protein